MSRDNEDRSGIDRRQLLSAAAGLAATLGTGAVIPAAAQAAPLRLARDASRYPYENLREYVAALEARGLVLRVPRLDQDAYEMTALMYKLIDEFGWYGAPCLVADEVKQDGRWMKGPVVTNHQGHWDTEALVWGRARAGQAARDLPADDRLPLSRDGGEQRHGPVPADPRGATRAGADQGSRPDRRAGQPLRLSFIKSNPGDPARYVNTGSVFTSDPKLGMNDGTYRCEIKGPRLLGVNPEPGQSGWKMLMAAKERGEKTAPVSIVIGQDPISWFVSGSMISRSGADELAIAGGLRGKPIDVVKSETNHHMIPANAELVIEGDILLDRWEPEGRSARCTATSASRRTRTSSWR